MPAHAHAHAPVYAAPVTAGQFHGELQLTPDGMTFTPVSTRDGDQLVLGVSGWHLSWTDIAGIERVDPHGRVRVHYDGAARFVAIHVHGDLHELFAAVDAQLAAVRLLARPYAA